MKDVLKETLQSFAKGQAALAKMKPTFCFEIMADIHKKVDRIKNEECHYTASGITSVVKDFDGQKYRIDITPIREKK